MTTKHISSLPIGSIVKYENFSFYIIEHTSATRVKLLSVDVVKSASDYFHNRANISSGGYYDQSDTSSIAYDLNRNNYYNTLPTFLKNLIVSYTWNVGTRNNESGVTRTARIGLLTKSEWERLGEAYGGPIPRATSTSAHWTLTLYKTGPDASVYYIHDGKVSSSVYGVRDHTLAVRPTFYVNSSSLFIDDNGNMTLNSEPIITPSITPSGTYATKPSFNYLVSDADNNAMTVTESIDGIVFNTRTNVASGTQLTFTPTDLAWLRTRINQTVNIEITADDGNGGVTTVTYPITRTTPAIDLQLKTPFETDVAARRLLLQLEGNIPNDAIVSVQACNNAFDTNPTWENATNLVLSGFPYPFSNTTKTATKWGVSFKVRIERGSSTQPIYIDGIGGAFD